MLASVSTDAVGRRTRATRSNDDCRVRPLSPARETHISREYHPDSTRSRGEQLEESSGTSRDTSHKRRKPGLAPPTLRDDALTAGPAIRRVLQRPSFAAMDLRGLGRSVGWLVFQNCPRQPRVRRGELLTWACRSTVSRVNHRRRRGIVASSRRGCCLAERLAPGNAVDVTVFLPLQPPFATELGVRVVPVVPVDRKG